MKSRIRPLIFLAVLCTAAAAVLDYTPQTHPGRAPAAAVRAVAATPANPSAIAPLPRIGTAHAALPAQSGQVPRVVESYGRLPLAFEANAGQTDSQVKFISRGRGYTMFLTGTEAVLSLKKPSALSPQQSVSYAMGATTDKGLRTTNEIFPALIKNPKSQFQNLPAPSTQSPVPEVLRMKLVGANAKAKVTGADPLPGRSNYFIGNDPKKWRTNVPSYGRVKYESVYPGIDLVYYGNQRQLEYDFVVAPGADPKAIAFDIVGADGARPTQGERRSPLRVDPVGDLVIPTDGGDVRLHKPVVYQPVAPDFSSATAMGTSPLQPNPESKIKNPKSVDGRFVLLAQNRVGFEVENYDTTKPLVIDPVLTYASYLGGTSNDWGFRIGLDAARNIYIAGATISEDFPTTSAAFQTGIGGTGCGWWISCNPHEVGDVFVTKLDATGSNIAYSTYIGGSNGDYPLSLVVDAGGSAYLSGGTNSPNYPVTPGAYQQTFGGYTDAIVTKLDPTGSSLEYSTFLGTGIGGERGFCLAVDSDGNAYVTGDAAPDFPTTPGAYMTGTGGAYVTKINPTGTGLVYSTHLASSSPSGTWGVGIAVDSSGNAYVVGSTSDFFFPTTPGAFQTLYGSWSTGSGDAFVTILNADGTDLLYSTFLGGSGAEFWPASIAIDTDRNIYVTGTTASADFPVTLGAFQPTYSGSGNDFYVTKLNPSLSGPESLVFSTYLRAGTASGWGGGMALDPMGNTHITGTLGGQEVFVDKLNPTGSELVYSITVGGSLSETNGGIAADNAGNTYVIGSSDSPDFPTTSNALQPTSHGGTEAFVLKILSGPSVGLSPTALDFGKQVINSTSPGKSVLLTNNGGDPLTVSDVSITGEFAQTNDCVKVINVGEHCSIGVTFSPTEILAQNGVITIEDDAFGHPHTIALTGFGMDFNFDVQEGGSTSDTVSPGETAVFHLQIGGTAGASGTATLACQENIPNASCGVQPGSVTLNGTTPSTFIVSVATTPPTAARAPLVMPDSGPGGPKSQPLSWMWVAALALMLGTMAASRRRERLVLMAAMLFVVLWSSCVGNSPRAATSISTPSGVYPVTATATVNGVTKSFPLTVTVN